VNRAAAQEFAALAAAVAPRSDDTRAAMIGQLRLTGSSTMPLL
jgi:hypothetical protein